ncbi:MAG: shikimate dehydrogenase [Bacillaceae bacterium]|jgi:shikimate dehydrogenase|uniref:Shikimate dehydrogenase (NADP(+)) n=1 Tax=Aeribacillus composti TaxID=1868734 RepID=A0ABY9W9M3_9BACI|nr:MULTISPECIES: shikimate dehydrogenase [Aeribacillus]AXI40172.1 shikimate dehydrogenase [Bacillaceae bacterium ZC4]REJ21423.1 MAG: shikimate dehydrogenase [Bacillaceae bacterium]KZM54207.1 shikimate dehydrogenase [Aeribacillus pallidus]MDR9792156.1 shikimate dehydrogenase [Aeribacillus pallidus]MED0649984.1 shikimate dehydrogenase [Aeribacillus composti]
MEQVYGVIGDPIGHSLSPLIHNDAFDYLNMNARYHAFQVKGEELEQAVKGMKALGIKGFNVTVPHKVSIIPFLDELDESAQLLHAVNTVKNEDGRLIGFNTDGYGFYLSLKEHIDNTNPRDLKVLLIGAGGAARAIYTTLAKEGFAFIDIVNRTAERAHLLKENCSYETKGNVYSFQQLDQTSNEYDVIIQTTSIGMKPNIEEKPIELTGRVHGGTVVADIIYNPLKTMLLKEAEKLGLKTVDGVGMFVYQGACAFQIWTNVEPDVSRMKKLVYEKLGGKS